MAAKPSLDKLLPGRSWKPGFTVGRRGSGEKVGRWGGSGGGRQGKWVGEVGVGGRKCPPALSAPGRIPGSTHVQAV